MAITSVQYPNGRMIRAIKDVYYIHPANIVISRFDIKPDKMSYGTNIWFEYMDAGEFHWFKLDLHNRLEVWDVGSFAKMIWDEALTEWKKLHPTDKRNFPESHILGTPFIEKVVIPPTVGTEFFFGHEGGRRL